MKRQNICISFGENCLTDNILSRFGLKSFSTPFSSARSNIEYILQIEKDDYKNFLNPKYFKYALLNGKQVVRLTTYNTKKNRYEELCENGFEFTHHDVISCEKFRDDFERRFNRLRQLHNVNLFIFYHHRYCPDTDMDMLLKHLSQLRSIYLKRCPKVEIIMFTQVIENNIAKRCVEYVHASGVHVYKLHTMQVWCGDDANVFWARCDDDLLLKMLQHCKKKIGLRINFITLLKHIKFFKLFNFSAYFKKQT